MKERPILFSATMVRALLAGTKTQTRRVWKMPRGCDWYSELGGEREGWFVDHGQPWWLHVSELRCPYGQPEDRLWVRETHAPQADCWGSWERWARGDGGIGPIIHYAADSADKPFIDRWRPSIHMPRWASRITLEITGIRVERLQDISEADAIAEGCSLECMSPAGDDSGSAIYGPEGYRALWESINGAGSWDANPWVWVVDFKRVEGGAA